MNGPRLWDETTGRRVARGILVGLAEDETQPVTVRMAILAAIGELEDDLPAGYVLPPVDPQPGTLEHARQLLLDDVERQPSIREYLATSRAAAQLVLPA